MGNFARGLFCLAVFVCVVSFGIETKPEQLAALETVLSELNTHYGMLKYKNRMYGITLDRLRNKYSRLIQDATTLEEDLGLVPKHSREVLPSDEFRQMLIGLAGELRDGHTNILRQSSNAWTVGITTVGIGGRLFVTGFDRDYFSPTMVHPALEPGDEVVAVDGVAVDELAKREILYCQSGTFRSRYHQALEQILFISHRWQRRKTDGAAVNITFAKTNSKGARTQTFEATLNWTPTKDARELRALNRYLPGEPAAKPRKVRYLYGLTGHPGSYFDEGLRKQKLPYGMVLDVGMMLNGQIRKVNDPANKDEDEALGVDLKGLRPVERLSASIIQHKGKNLGVIRIPSYHPGLVRDAVDELKWLYAIIKIMENRTDVLILDQLSNGGGYVFQANNFLRMFADRGPIRTGLIDIKLSETFFRRHDFVPAPEDSTRKEIDGVSDTFGRAILQRKVIQDLRKKFDGGEKWSGPVSFFDAALDFAEGEEGQMIAKRGSVYTKPVMILNDQRSASGGDFMPAFLQANGRAIIYGETSAGLGGPVYRSQDSLPGSEMHMRCTMGYCVRTDGLPIENLGVVPDIERTITLADFKEGFTTYSREVLETAWQWSDGKRTDGGKAKRATSAKVSPASELWNTRIHQFEAVLKQTNELAEIQSLYASFFRTLGPEVSEETGIDEETRAPIPLPAVLTQVDVLLAALSDRDEVVDRLRDLRSLERFQSAEFRSLIDTLIDGLSGMGQVRVARCVDLLKVATN